MFTPGVLAGNKHNVMPDVMPDFRPDLLFLGNKLSGSITSIANPIKLATGASVI